MGRAQNRLILSGCEQLVLSKSIYPDLQQQKNLRSTRQKHSSTLHHATKPLVAWNGFTKKYKNTQPTFQGVQTGQETFHPNQTYAVLCSLSCRDFIIASRLFPKSPILSLLCSLACNIFRFFFSQGNILQRSCHGLDHNHTSNLISFLMFTGVYVLQYELTNVCTQALASEQHDFPWFIKTHPSPVQQNHSPLLRAGVQPLPNMETIWWHVLRENITKQCPTHDLSQQKTSPSHAGTPSSKAAGVPQGASCCGVRKMSVATMFMPCVHTQNTQIEPLDLLKLGIFREEMRVFRKVFQCLLTLTGKKWHPSEILLAAVPRHHTLLNIFLPGWRVCYFFFLPS